MCVRGRREELSVAQPADSCNNNIMLWFADDGIGMERNRETEQLELVAKKEE